MALAMAMASSQLHAQQLPSAPPSVAFSRAFPTFSPFFLPLSSNKRPSFAAPLCQLSSPLAPQPTTSLSPSSPSSSSSSSFYDAIIIGAGIGGLVAATQLAVRGARVLLLEKYVIPGGSSGFFERQGFTFDVGSSVMFGCGEKGSTNLVTRALAAVGRKLELIPDPTTVHYHLPNGLSVRVHREYEAFLYELTSLFPHEAEGIRGFYDECWKVFNALNSLELKSLEEPLYLFGQFFRKPIACLTLAYYLPQNAGDIARKHIKDPILLSFIDAECFIVSTVDACRTPMINASMVICDRHYGGINYPVGGVGCIAKHLAAGLVENGGDVQYKANVKKIIIKDGKAVFNALNSLELKSLEEPLYLFGQFFRKPIACLTLAYYLPQNAGDIARKHIKDPILLSFIDAEA